MRFKIRTLIAVVCLMLFGTAALLAQVTSGAVTGTVTDPQGAVIPGAKIILIDEVQATTRALDSSAEGTFTFTPVLPSTYTLAVEAGGFKKFEKRGIKVSPGDRIEVSDIKLTVGSVSETLTVEANAIALKTETAQRDSVLVSEQIVDAPIVDRKSTRLN